MNDIYLHNDHLTMVYYEEILYIAWNDKQIVKASPINSPTTPSTK